MFNQQEATRGEYLRPETDRQDGNFHLEGSDELVDDNEMKSQMAMEAKCASGQCKSMPSKQLLRLKVSETLK